MTAHHLWLAALVLLFLSASANAAEVRVRVVYLNDGKPARDQRIGLTLGNPQSSAPTEFASTNSEGIAIFPLPNRVPLIVWVDEENGRIEGCARNDVIPLEAVMKMGVTLGVDERYGKSCKGDRSIMERLKAKPGEIVIFVRKVTIWDDLRRY